MLDRLKISAYAEARLMKIFYSACRL